MQISQSKPVELLFMAFLTIGLLLTALHAKDIVPQLTGVKAQKIVKDDSNTNLLRKIVSDWHNHIDKYSVKNMKITVNNFAVDSRSLKKQLFNDKLSHKLLD